MTEEMEKNVAAEAEEDEILEESATCEEPQNDEENEIGKESDSVDVEEEQQDSEEEEVASDDKETEEKKGFFKKKKDKKDEQIEELNDRVRRQMAEFDNFRKRTEKEKSQMFDMGAKTIVEKILPVIDNFERGFTTVEEADKEDAFVQGMDMVYKQLMTELAAVGVTPIECLGKEFDPELHNAVMQVESEEFESGIVAQELQKGYMYKDSVVRHSMVAVVS